MTSRIRTIDINRMRRDPAYTNWVRENFVTLAEAKERINRQRTTALAKAKRRRRAAEKIARAQRKENRQ